LTRLYASAESIWQAAMALQEPSLAGFSVEVLPEIDSTNTELMRRARTGRSEPTLLVAQEQTAGKGRLGRPWHSGTGQISDAQPVSTSTDPSSVVTTAQPGRTQAPTTPSAVSSSLTFSIGLLLKPQAWDGLSLAVGVSVAENLHKELQLKWPNDLWWQGRKLAGILIETASIGAQRYAVVGVGINIAHRPATGLSTPPAWLQELEPAITDAHALERIAAPLLRDLLLFERQGFAPFAARFAARDALRGHNVTVIEHPTTVPASLHSDLHGTAQGVDGQGALLLHTVAGVQRIQSSEVSVRPLLVGR
jgi:BirA family transcriptional regulator, biotin operon repressor / biotin---[acetyl-CoA-carboxylase] ligase